MGNAERTEPLLLIGPRGLAKVVASLRVIAPELPFEVKCMEITENAQTFSFEGFRLEAFKVNHNVLCYGYSMVIDRAGRFDKDRALEQEIPMKFWSRLQKGETLEENGRVFTPDMVLGAERKGLKVTYSTPRIMKFRRRAPSHSISGRRLLNIPKEFKYNLEH